MKFLAVFIAAATIIFFSCNWFQSKKKETANPLIGYWQLDSVKVGKDSSFVYFLLLAAQDQDSTVTRIRFEKDTIFTVSGNSIDTAFYSFDEKEKHLTVKDLIPYAYSVKKLSDSLISLTAFKDSSVLFLKKE